MVTSKKFIISWLLPVEMDICLLLQLFCIGTLGAYVLGNEHNVAKFTKVDCISVDPEYIAVEYCRVRAVKRDLYLINIRAVFIKPADELSLRIKLFKKYSSFKPFLVDITENFCDFLSKKRVSTYMKIIGSIYLPYSNLNTSCPVEGPIIFMNMPMTANTMPSIWPTGEYRVDITLMRIEKILATLRIHFALEEKISENVLNVG